MLIRKMQADGRHRAGIPYLNQEMANILAAVEQETGDLALAQSIYFSPTALTHIKRLIDMGGSIITDTTLVANDIGAPICWAAKARKSCVLSTTRRWSCWPNSAASPAREVAVDYGLAVPGPKLMVGGQRAGGHQPPDPAAHARADVGRVCARRAQRLCQRRATQGTAVGQRPGLHHRPRQEGRHSRNGNAS